MKQDCQNQSTPFERSMQGKETRHSTIAFFFFNTACPNGVCLANELAFLLNFIRECSYILIAESVGFPNHWLKVKYSYILVGEWDQLFFVSFQRKWKWNVLTSWLDRISDFLRLPNHCESENIHTYWWMESVDFFPSQEMKRLYSLMDKISQLSSPSQVKNRTAWDGI